jgi:hypothetical protein
VEAERPAHRLTEQRHVVGKPLFGPGCQCPVVGRAEGQDSTDPLAALVRVTVQIRADEDAAAAVAEHDDPLAGEVSRQDLVPEERDDAILELPQRHVDGGLFPVLAVADHGVA